MSKKVTFPVMSMTITGVLFIVGWIFLTLRGLVANLVAPTQVALINGLFGFISVFLLIWALTSFCLHPDIDDTTFKVLLAAAAVIIIIHVFSPTFLLTIAAGF